MAHVVSIDFALDLFDKIARVIVLILHSECREDNVNYLLHVFEKLLAVSSESFVNILFEFDKHIQHLFHVVP